MVATITKEVLKHKFRQLTHLLREKRSFVGLCCIHCSASGDYEANGKPFKLAPVEVVNCGFWQRYSYVDR